MKIGPLVKKTQWQHPQSYFGYSPTSDYLIMSVNRDSSIEEESNWTIACQQLNADTPAIDPDKEPPVYTWRAQHAMCGWIEYLMIRHDAPEEIFKIGEAILESLENYAILSDDDVSAREYDVASKAWENASIKERLHYLRNTDISIFAARRSELPDNEGELIELLARN